MPAAFDKFRSWIVRQRDQNLVSYSRFGRPGEEEDDRAPPTTILVAPFNENGSEFIVFGCWHVQRAAVACACFGMSMVTLFFILTFFEFDWYQQSRGVDISALLGLFLYLALGVLVHYYVLHGIKKQAAYYLLPFILIYSIMAIAELAGILALVLRIFDPTAPLHTSAFFMFGVFAVSLLVQLVMLFVVLKCRHFISLKNGHEMELKVAERSKSENPAIRIVVAGSAEDASRSSASQLSPPSTDPRLQSSGADHLRSSNGGDNAV